MRFIETKVLVDTDQSLQWKRIHEDDDEFCDRDLLATRPLLINIDSIVAVYPDFDRRCTSLDVAGDNYYLVPVKYEDLILMLKSEDCWTII